MALLDAKVAAKFAVLALAACGTPEAPHPPEFAAALNVYRRGRGLGALASDETLTRAAAAHAEEMDRLHYYGHYSPVPDNRTPDDRLRRQGWPLDRLYVELLCFAESGGEALEKWQGKPEYDAALRGADYTVVGFARSGRYCVLLLAE